LTLLCCLKRLDFKCYKYSILSNVLNTSLTHCCEIKREFKDSFFVPSRHRALTEGQSQRMMGGPSRDPRKRSQQVDRSSRRPKRSIAQGRGDENQNDVINRRNGQGPKHLKFFLLVFAKDEAQGQSPSPRRPKPKKPKSKP